MANKTKVKGDHQDKLPGMKQVRDNAIHAKALEYHGYQVKRSEFLAKEVASRQELEILMKNKKLEFYDVDGVEVKIVATEIKAKVKIKEAGDLD
jgi:hypothetical protein